MRPLHIQDWKPSAKEEGLRGDPRMRGIQARGVTGWGGDSPQIGGVWKGGFLSVKQLPGGSLDVGSHSYCHLASQGATHELMAPGEQEEGTSSLWDAATSHEVLLSELWLYV